MQVAQVSMFYFPITGGQQVYVANLNRILSGRGFLTEVMQLGSWRLKHDGVVTLPRVPGINRLFPDASWFLFNMHLGRIKERLKRANVVVCHYPFHYPVLRWHPRVVVVSHGVDWCVPPVTLADKHRLRSALLCKQDGAIIVANDKHFLSSLGFDVASSDVLFRQVRPNIWLIPNCVDTFRFRPLDVTREKIVIVPRNIRWVRGIHTAIEAFRKFAQLHPDFSMHIVGGPLRGNYYRFCVGLVRKYRLEERIFFIGSVPWEGMPVYYNRSRLTLIPTLDLEGTSLSAIESMACGTPVVSSEVGGLSDLPTVKADLDAESISGRLEEVLGNWEKVSVTQYEQVVDVFNFDRWKQAWNQVIDVLIGC